MNKDQIRRSEFRLKIASHSAELINQIDLKTESLLITLNSSSQTPSSKNALNNQRQTFINEIKRVELENLRNVEVLDLGNTSEPVNQERIIFKKFCFLVQINSATYLIVLNEYVDRTVQNLFSLFNLDSVSFFDFSRRFKAPQRIELKIKDDQLLSGNTDFIVRKNRVQDLFENSEILFKDLFIEHLSSNAFDLFSSVKRIELVFSQPEDSYFGYMVTDWRGVIRTVKAFTRGFTGSRIVLKKLHLTKSDLNLGGLEPDTFQDLCNLEILHLDENQLACLNENLFNCLVNLTELYLTDNELTSLSSNIFFHVSNLKILYLKRNKIKEISLSLFSGD